MSYKVFIMLRIRFIRTGKKNRPNFRLVVTPQRSAPQTGRFLEVLGNYDPIRHTRVFKKERIQYWLSQGAQPSDSVLNMFISDGITEGKKIAVHSRAPKKKVEEAKTAAPEGGEPRPDEAGREVASKSSAETTPAPENEAGQEASAPEDTSATPEDTSATSEEKASEDLSVKASAKEEAQAETQTEAKTEEAQPAEQPPVEEVVPEESSEEKPQSSDEAATEKSTEEKPQSSDEAATEKSTEKKPQPEEATKEETKLTEETTEKTKEEESN